MKNDAGEKRHRTNEAGAVGRPAVEVRGRILMPSSGKFRNSGISLPGELWTFKSDEFSVTKKKASLRAILEDGDGTPSRN